MLLDGEDHETLRGLSCTPLGILILQTSSVDVGLLSFEISTHNLQLHYVLYGMFC